MGAETPAAGAPLAPGGERARSPQRMGSLRGAGHLRQEQPRRLSVAPALVRGCGKSMSSSGISGQTEEIKPKRRCLFSGSDRGRETFRAIRCQTISGPATPRGREGGPCVGTPTQKGGGGRGSRRQREERVGSTATGNGGRGRSGPERDFGPFWGRHGLRFFLVPRGHSRWLPPSRAARMTRRAGDSRSGPDPGRRLPRTASLRLLPGRLTPRPPRLHHGSGLGPRTPRRGSPLPK